MKDDCGDISILFRSRFGLGFDSELYLFTKSDGRVWRVTEVIQKEKSAQAGI